MPASDENHRKPTWETSRRQKGASDEQAHWLEIRERCTANLATVQ
jgi:hypothetical protein